MNYGAIGQSVPRLLVVWVLVALLGRQFVPLQGLYAQNATQTWKTKSMYIIRLKLQPRSLRPSKRCHKFNMVHPVVLYQYIIMQVRQ